MDTETTTSTESAGTTARLARTKPKSVDFTEEKYLVQDPNRPDVFLHSTLEDSVSAPVAIVYSSKLELIKQANRLKPVPREFRDYSAYLSYMHPTHDNETGKPVLVLSKFLCLQDPQEVPDSVLDQIGKIGSVYIRASGPKEVFEDFLPWEQGWSLRPVRKSDDPTDTGKDYIRGIYECFINEKLIKRRQNACNPYTRSNDRPSGRTWYPPPNIFDVLQFSSRLSGVANPARYEVPTERCGMSYCLDSLDNTLKLYWRNCIKPFGYRNCRAYYRLVVPAALAWEKTKKKFSGFTKFLDWLEYETTQPTIRKLVKRIKTDPSFSLDTFVRNQAEWLSDDSSNIKTTYGFNNPFVAKYFERKEAKEQKANEQRAAADTGAQPAAEPTASAEFAGLDAGGDAIPVAAESVSEQPAATLPGPGESVGDVESAETACVVS